jgi:hypothetical protein
MGVDDLDVDDYHDLGNALFGGGPKEVPARVSFEIEWSGAKRRFSARNTNGGNRYAGRYIEISTATIDWSAETEGFRFESSADSSETEFAEIGHERNGAFFS